MVTKFWEFVGQMNIWLWAVFAFGFIFLNGFLPVVGIALGVVAVFTNSYSKDNEFGLTEQQQSRMILSLLCIAPHFSIGALMFRMWQKERR